MSVIENGLDKYLHELKNGEHHFENVFESLARMIFDDPKEIKSVIVNGKNTYDFLKFRTGKKTYYRLVCCNKQLCSFYKRCRGKR
jgi:hypothetical protein